jgi:ABC-type lipoprotein export system ATPase subunit
MTGGCCEGGVSVVQENLHYHCCFNTIIVVTHEEDIAKRARRVIRLRDGMIESDTSLYEEEASRATL